MTSAWRHFLNRRDLLWQFTLRAIEMKHRGSHLGMLWAVLTPLLMLALYGTVFGVFFRSRFNVLPDETGVDFALGVFLGLILFHVLAETLAMAPTLIAGNSNLVKKVVFPLEILPLAQLGAFWFNFLISLALLLGGIAVAGRGVTLHGLLWLPVIVLPHLLLTIGLGWFLAAFGVFFRDAQQVIQFVTQIILYASAVFYSTAAIPPAAWAVLKWNPLLHTVTLARDALLWNLPVNLPRLAYAYAAGLAVFALGGWFFRRMQPAFADVV